MKRWLLVTWMALAAITTPAGAAATEDEIQHLLDFVRDSNAVFIRNGKEYKPAEAAEHLMRKRDHYKDQIKTAEDFIRLAATKSVMSGKPYSVKTVDGKTRPASEWLTEELGRYREKEKSAPPATAGATDPAQSRS